MCNTCSQLSGIIHNTVVCRRVNSALPHLPLCNCVQHARMKRKLRMRYEKCGEIFRSIFTQRKQLLDFELTIFTQKLNFPPKFAAPKAWKTRETQ